jgi:hypothetical protein
MRVDYHSIVAVLTFFRVTVSATLLMKEMQPPLKHSGRCGIIVNEQDDQSFRE